MKVKALMISDPITISSDASIEAAIQLMKANHIRHLPVTLDNGWLKGFVTLADLKEGLLPSMVTEISLKDLIIQNPITVGPEDDIETAAQRIYRHKISGMPVVDEGRVVGIITETDVLRMFIDMMGILTEGSRIEVEIENPARDFKRVVHIIQDTGGDVINVSNMLLKGQNRIYYFRLSRCQTGPITSALASEGFTVLDAAD
jgi:acetoin utilization protein AcuB